VSRGAHRYKCKPFLLRNLAGSGFGAPTPIQAQAIPALLQGAELLAIAPTGSGKTLAFLVPIVVALQKHKPGGPRALLLCPTRELANQTTRVLRVLMKERTKLLHTAVVTKANMGSVDWNQMDIVLSNPLRLKALIEGGKIELSGVRFLVSFLGVTRRASWVPLRARWVTLRARWVPRRASWVPLRARWVTFRCLTRLTSSSRWASWSKSTRRWARARTRRCSAASSPPRCRRRWRSSLAP
jgi:hypothetical protein